MARIKMLKGLPGSGKSTKAKELVLADDGKTVRVNRDALRQMLFCMEKDAKGDARKFAQKNERMIKKIEEMIVKYCINDKHFSVVIDDCNLGKSNVELWEKVALTNNHGFDVVEVDTPVDECIKRDAARDQSVGKSVILRMAGQFGLYNKDAGQPKGPIKPSDSKAIKKIVLCDIDGTIANCDHRLHHLESSPKDWDSFFADMVNDSLREGVASMLSQTYKDHTIVMLTARPASHMAETEAWLKKHNVEYDHLIMRKSGDFRSDVLVKGDILDKFFDKNDIEIVIDDRPAVIALWRKNGLGVIDVGDGKDF